jgi:hypothetical protein
MLLHPGVQLKAQQVLDAFLEPGQLPRFEDAAQLPFITAIVWETIRWRPLGPVGTFYYLYV